MIKEEKQEEKIVENEQESSNRSKKDRDHQFRIVDRGGLHIFAMINHNFHERDRICLQFWSQKGINKLAIT